MCVFNSPLKLLTVSVDFNSGGNAFQRRGATCEKLLSLTRLNLHLAGIGSMPEVDDLSRLLCVNSKASVRYSGAVPRTHLNIVTNILNSIRNGIFSQWRDLNIGETWSYFRVPVTERAHIFCMYCKRCNSHFDEPISKLLQ